MRRMNGDVGAAGVGGGIGSGVVCTTVPLAARLVNVVGTSNTPLGYRLRKLPTRQKTSKAPIGYDPKEGMLQLIEDEKRQITQLECKMLEEKQKQWKNIEIEIKKKVDLGMEAYEEDLEERRDKLRELLVHEEAQLTRELVERARKLEEERAVELEAKAVEAAEEAEASRLELLREKQLQRYVENNEELREERRRAWTEDSKRVNRIQIAETEQHRRREQEEESFWHDLAVNRSRVEAEEITNLASKRTELEIKTALKLKEQMQERELQRQQWAAPVEYGVLIVGEKEESEEMRREKKRQIKEDLDRQLQQARTCLEQRCSEEKKLDEMNAIFSKRELGFDEVRKDKEAKRKEMLTFMESMKDFREAVSRREAEAEECLRRSATEVELKRREAARRAREERVKLCKETKLVWDRQLEEKRRQQLLELEVDKDDETSNIISEKEEKARRRQAAQEYGRELMAQHDWIEARRVREQKEFENMIEQQRVAREREEAQIARELKLRK